MVLPGEVHVEQELVGGGQLLLGDDHSLGQGQANNKGVRGEVLLKELIPYLSVDIFYVFRV